MTTKAFYSVNHNEKIYLLLKSKNVENIDNLQKVTTHEINLNPK